MGGSACILSYHIQLIPIKNCKQIGSEIMAGHQVARQESWQNVANALSFIAGILNNCPDVNIVGQLYKSSTSNFDFGEGHKLINKYLTSRRLISTKMTAEELAADWARIFRGISGSSGCKPPYAGVYIASDGIGIDTMLEINNFYLEFGLGIDSDSNQHDRTDYLGTELEFLSILAGMIAEDDEADRAKAYLDEFTECYIISWLANYVEEAKGYAKTDFFKGFLIMLNDVLEELYELKKTEQIYKT